MVSDNIDIPMFGPLQLRPRMVELSCGRLRNNRNILSPKLLPFSLSLTELITQIFAMKSLILMLERCGKKQNLQKW